MRKSSDTNCRFQHSSYDLQKAWQAQIQLSQWWSFSQRTSALLYRCSGYWGKAKQNMLPRGLHRNFIRNVILYLLTLWEASLLVPENHFSQGSLTFWSGHHREKLKWIVEEKKNPTLPRRTQCTELYREFVSVPHFYNDAFAIPKLI